MTIQEATVRLKPNATEIRRALDILFEPGDIVEARAFRGRRCTISGYYNDFDQLTKDAAIINSQGVAVYVTLNRINSDLLSRRANRYEQFATTTTSDDQVVRRRWFPIDLDPARPSGVSASDKEHNAAIEKAREIRRYLAGELGWPEPIAADSGNGAHLLFRIDVPNNTKSTQIVKGALQAIDTKFSDKVVAVDVGNFNASRIWKLYGTVARKGDNVGSRRHRQSKLLYVPDSIETVQAKLRALADTMPKTAAPGKRKVRGPQRISSDNGKLDVTQWLREHNVDVLHDEPYSCEAGSGHRWVLDRCVWNPEHDDKSAYIIQFDSGGLSAGCWHNSCTGKGWHELRDTVEPGWRDRRSVLESVSVKPSEATVDLPNIVLDLDEKIAIDESIQILAGKQVFSRGGLLVEVIRDVDPPPNIAIPKDAPRIVTLRQARIRELLASSAGFLKPIGGDKFQQVHPPSWLIQGVDARGYWPGIRKLVGVVESPALRVDGTVLQRPGYDPTTALIYQPQKNIPVISEQPNKNDALTARDDLLETVCDFPFADESHRAAWLAMILTLLARFAYPGGTPLFLIDSNTRGSGKGLLADSAVMIASGRAAARMALPPKDEEFRKLVTSLALAGQGVSLLDNVAGTLGCSALDAALTANTWSDRVLGESRMAVDLPLRMTWIVTANNPILRGDTARRTIHIRLESPEERPEERAGFRHPHLLSWIEEHRSRLVAAGLTILRGYCAAGRPDLNLPAWGSFEGWSDLIRQSVVWVGLPDPGITRRELEGVADSETLSLVQLIEGWEELDPGNAGMTISEALKLLEKYPEEFAILRTAIEDLAPMRGEKLNKRSIGMRFHHLRQRVVQGKALDNRHVKRGAVWYIRSSKKVGTTGTSGTKSRSTREKVLVNIGGNDKKAQGALVSPASPSSPHLTKKGMVPPMEVADSATPKSAGLTECPAGCREVDRVVTVGTNGRRKQTCKACGRFYGYIPAVNTPAPTLLNTKGGET